MDSEFAIGIVAIVLAVINGIIMLYGLVKAWVNILEVVVIIALAGILPYCLAVFAKNLSSRDGLGNAMNTWMVSGLLLMVATSFYLYYKFKSSKSSTNN